MDTLKESYQEHSAAKAFWNSIEKAEKEEAATQNGQELQRLKTEFIAAAPVRPGKHRIGSNGQNKNQYMPSCAHLDTDIFHDRLPIR